MMFVASYVMWLYSSLHDQLLECCTATRSRRLPIPAAIMDQQPITGGVIVYYGGDVQLLLRVGAWE
jgi:hypothetical protein